MICHVPIALLTPIHTQLCPHPACTAPMHLSVSATILRNEVGDLLLSYRVHGDLAKIIIPEPVPVTAVPCDGLWQHTCCEAFIATAHDVDYREFNLSPSGQWAAYRFSDYRQIDPQYRPSTVPRISCQKGIEDFQLDAHLPSLPFPRQQILIMGLSVVIEAANGSKSYWALDHAGSQPDFHHRQSFTLTLPPLLP